MRWRWIRERNTFGPILRVIVSRGIGQDSPSFLNNGDPILTLFAMPDMADEEKDFFSVQFQAFKSLKTGAPCALGEVPKVGFQVAPTRVNPGEKDASVMVVVRSTPIGNNAPCRVPDGVEAFWRRKAELPHLRSHTNCSRLTPTQHGHPRQKLRHASPFQTHGGATSGTEIVTLALTCCFGVTKSLPSVFPCCRKIGL